MSTRPLKLLTVILAFILILIPAVTNADADTNGTTSDIMIVCAHPGDEYLFLGGILPIYAGEQGRSVVVVYLSSIDEAQRDAAVDGLARFGATATAVFGPFSPAYTSTKELAARYWNTQEVTAYLVGVIRAYKPAVVVTHDVQGEYGHGAHRLTAECVQQAVKASAHVNQYDESSKLYGGWQVQRLFLHLYGGDPVSLDRSKPLSHFGDKTALTLDQEAYQGYPDPYPIKITDGPGYTAAKYGLAYAHDEGRFVASKGNLLEGLGENILNPTATPVPDPTATPEQTAPAATPVPTETVAETSTEMTAQPFAPDASAAMTPAEIVIAAVMGACAIAGLVYLLVVKKDVFPKWAILIPIGVLVLVAVFTVYKIVAHTLSEATEPMVQPPVSAAAAPTQKPAETPEPEEAAPTPTPHPWDEYFRSDSDPAEVVVTDLANEHWEYRSDNLSVIINRIHTQRADGKPVCYCVAEIRMRGEDAFRAGLFQHGENIGSKYQRPWILARNEKAVLAITGDNLTRAETELKGVLMRDGHVFSTNQAQDTLVFFPKDLTMKVYKPKTFTAEELLEQGVLNTFSFGPTLLNNGVRDSSSKRGNLGNSNPRCGVGMVEPGYFIAITADGRQAKYSVGLTLDEFAHLFYSYGCTVAYNLDGGSSTAMVFMGECLSQHSGERSDVMHDWADALIWGKSDLVPTIEEPIHNDGSRPWVPYT